MLNMFRLVLMASAAVMTAGCVIDVQGEGSVLHEQKRMALTGVPEVTVRTFDGAVELRPWDRNEILLEIERRGPTAAAARSIQVNTTQADNHVIIEAVRSPRRDRGGIGNWNRRSVRLTLTVPRHSNIEARSGDGTLLARDLSGRIDLRTGDGGVRVRGLDGEITMTTGDGNVSATDLAGQVSVRTGDGSVELAGRFDALTAHTGDGNIRIDAHSGSVVRREWSITSGDGPVTLRLPRDFDADLDARTGDGQITTSGVILDAQSEPGERRILRGRLGSGGDVLLLRTGDGPIAIIAR